STLNAIASSLEVHEPAPTARITWDILAANRPDVARAFLEARPDRLAPENWQLRFELARRTGNPAAARRMVVDAAARPGTAPPRQLVAAAFAAGLPDAVLTAAEHRAIPPLDRSLSLDLARRAAATGRHDLIARIDRLGTPSWRGDDPWLALDLARRAGDFPTALHYASLLPSGRAEARRALVIASGDKPAIRAMLLQEAATGNRGAIAQQLLDSGFRPDAIAVLQADCTSRRPTDPAAMRLLYLMGPRPDAPGLQWLRAQASRNAEWQDAYLEREKPSAALAYLKARGNDTTTAGLLQRLRLASAARDRSAGLALARQLLEGRALASAETAAVAAHAPPGLPSRLALALARSRVSAGSGSPQDHFDLAWDAWNHARTAEAQDLLATYLATRPADLPALRLMAQVESKRRGEAAAKVWLTRALAVVRPGTIESAELLERLGRRDEALDTVEKLRAGSPANAQLKTLHARLLIAAGDPGRARKILHP
ncbi:MAG: hypothetical protein WCY11_04485, partial [Novosphingobium sp.]